MPKQKDIDRIVVLIGKQYSNYDYFFKKLNTPVWIKPLLDKGFFKEPPIPHMYWPESEYLSRMASKAPKKVCDIILNTIPDTDNQMVHSDFVVAALELPPENKKKLVDITKKEIQWIEEQDLINSLIADKYGELIGKLIEYNEIKTALNLADILLEVLPDPKKNERTTSISPIPQARFESFYYKEVIRKNFPNLTKYAGIKTIDLLCNKLIKYIELSEKSDDDKFYKNYTYHWRPAIEDHEQNSGYENLGDFLVSAIRDMSVILIEHDKNEFPEIIANLRSKNSQIFDRIVLFLLNQFPDYLPDKVITSLTDENIFNSNAFLHEYSRLIDGYFDKLPPEKQNIIYGWIDNPDIERLRRSFKRNMDRDPDENEMIGQKERWQLRKLTLIENHLKGKRKLEYDKLLKRYGKLEHPDFAVYTSVGFVGPTSPISTEDFKEMTIDQIVERVNKWEWSRKLEDPTPEGLSRELSNIVKNEPERFADEAEKFKGLKEPTYVRGIIIGFRDALKDLKEDITFEWSSVLDLCQWAISQPREIEGRGENNFDIDPGWWWSWRWIPSLLEEGFESKESPIPIEPIEHQEQILEILSFLSEDPSPSEEEERRYDESNMDIATLSINTVRGVAMHAVIRYALWLKRNFDKQLNSDQHLSKGFDEMPEVREVLEKHLDIKHDRSYVIRSVYGQWFPWLVLLDDNWAKKNVLKIFPEKDEEKLYLKAAWETYIIFCRPDNNVFEVLQKQYSNAIDLLSKKDDKERGYADPENHLAEHLVTFYWSGIIGLEDSLFQKFWEKADDSLRGHAITFIGRNLGNTPGDLEKDILDRFTKLWDFRLSVAKGNGEKNSFKNEMASFGWWFTSKKFDDKWVLTKLHESLKISKKVEFVHEVVKKLAEISGQYPNDTFLCLNEIARGKMEIWEIHPWHKEAYTILENAMKSDDESIVQGAKDLANYLGSKGFVKEFRGLVK